MEHVKKVAVVLTVKERQFHAELAGVSNILLHIHFKKKKVCISTTVPLPVNIGARKL